MGIYKSDTNMLCILPHVCTLTISSTLILARYTQLAQAIHRTGESLLKLISTTHYNSLHNGTIIIMMTRLLFRNFEIQLSSLYKRLIQLMHIIVIKIN